MQAACNDPRKRTVKSRQGKVPLIVKPLKTGHKLECQCAFYNAVGICQDTIAVTEDLQCLPKYLEEIRKFQRKRAPGVNLTGAFNS